MDAVPSGSWVRRLGLASIGLVLLTGVARPVAAHAGSLSGSLQSVPVPSWLVVVTGGGVIGASFLFAALVTDHATIRRTNDRSVRLPWSPGWGTAVRLGQLIGILALVLVLLSGFIGPLTPARSFAVLVVWTGWWAGYPMTVYLIGNTWPGIDPWRGLSHLLPEDGRLRLPEGTAPWISAAGLLGLVWLEVVSPVAERPRLLATVILGYTVLALGGAVLLGRETWFGEVDPISRVFRTYGRMAPVRRTDEGLEVAFPGAALAAARTGEDLATPFVIALLWVTTFDGLVATPAWATAAGIVVGVGVPGHLLYLVTVVLGFWLFLWAFRFAARSARRTGETYVSAAAIGDWIAPSLVPIAAGYHLAHFLGYFLSLSPALVGVLAHPLSAPPAPRALVMPGWFGGLELLFVLLGHVLAIWIAHSRAFELFPGRLQPIRSQYPLIVVMIAYTVVSLWIVSQPFGSPPYV